MNVPLLNLRLQYAAVQAELEGVTADHADPADCRP